MEGQSGQVNSLPRDEDLRPVSTEPELRDMHESVFEERGLGIWHDLVDQSENLDGFGCGLAWIVVHAEAQPQTENSRRLVSSVFEKVCKTHGATTRLRGAIFPLRAGALRGLVEVLKICPFDYVMQESFTTLWKEDAWLLNCLVGLNRLAGFPAPLEVLPWSALERRAVLSLRQAVQRFLQLGGSLPAKVDAVSAELREKKVGYSGEEVSTVEPLPLEQVLPALPPFEHGGSINILDFVDEGTQDLLLNPQRLLLEDVGQELPKLQARVHCKEGDLIPLCHELVSRNICDWIPLEEVFKFRGTKVLSGLFGVRKASTLPSGLPVLRLIMNLIPSNSILKTLSGSVSRLPSITSWLSVTAEPGEEVLLWQSDMQSAFYLFSMPSCWKKFMSFNVIVSGEDIGRDPSIQYALCCTVLPMGWGSSVAVMQEVAERVLLLDGPEGAGQIVRGRPLPQFMVESLKGGERSGQPWWHVYLDNFCGGVRFNSEEARHRGDRQHQATEDCWSRAGIVSSEKKRLRATSSAVELGACIDGSQQCISVSGEKFLRLLSGSLYVVGLARLEKKLLQIIGGRWIHALQFRRAGMVGLSDIWKFIHSLGHSLELPFKVRRELVGMCLICPLLQTYLGATVDNMVSASDASMRGGAVGLSRELKIEGKDFVLSSLAAEKSGGQIPVLVISLFNGIGGSFRAYDILGVQPEGLIAVEKHGPANRVTSRRWPHATIVTDVRDIDDAMVFSWQLKYPSVTEVHLWAGFPCVDLSSAKANRSGLQGAESSLFYEVPRVRKLVEKRFSHRVTIRWVVENVTSMDRESCEEISYELSVRPYALDCSDAVPMRRPRLCWTSETLERSMDGIEAHHEQHWTRIVAPMEYPPVEAWIEPDCVWPGAEAGAIFPTCMKSIPRHAPPLKPAGLERCSEDTIARWRADSFRFPPYQYSDCFLIWRGDKWRLLSASERELLLGYGYDHTILCMSTSEAKQNKQLFEDTRRTLLGDSFSIYSFVIPCAALCKKFIPFIHYSHLGNRMGLSPGFRAVPRVIAPLRRSLAYGFQTLAQNQQIEVEALNRILLSRVNHTGSDIRISTGQILCPKAYPRQSIQASWWGWRSLFQTRWTAKEHINALELRSILLAVKYHVGHLRKHDCRIFHITDSYVCMSIIGKGRSSSGKLEFCLRQLNAILLLFNLYLIVAHVESRENPTDGASRS